MDPEPRPRLGRHYDWPAIKAAYVEGVDVAGKLTWPALDDVARTHGAIPSKVRERAAAEGWVEERATFQRRIELSRQQERGAEIARLGADLDVSVLRIVRAGLALSASRLTELSRLQQVREQAAASVQDGDLEGTAQALLSSVPLDAMELQRLGLSVRRWFDLGRDALGDVPTQHLTISGPDGPIEHSLDVAVEVRERHTKEIILALVEAGRLPQEVADTLGIDASERRALLEAARGDEGPAGDRDDAAPDEVHPA